MTAVTVAVTPEHIATGVPGDCQYCPIALAILDAIPAATHAEVWWAYGPGDEEGAGAAVWLARGTLTHRLGEDADAFVRAFDDRQPAEPFTFTITIPEEAA